jgi:ribose 5-phosphate isomerase A
MHDDEKMLAARNSIRYLRSNTLVGLGSGSTASFAVQYIAEEIQGGRLSDMRFVATSQATEKLANDLGLILVEMQTIKRIDLTIDGADEFDSKLQLIKGGGGALVREKIVASLSNQFIVIADSGKHVEVLGKFKLPVEVFSFIYAPLMVEFAKRGYRPALRYDSDGTIFISDNGNYIIDLDLKIIKDPFSLKNELADTPGIVDHGLFLDYADLVIMAKGKEILEFTR